MSGYQPYPSTHIECVSVITFRSHNHLYVYSDSLSWLKFCMLHASCQALTISSCAVFKNPDTEVGTIDLIIEPRCTHSTLTAFTYAAPLSISSEHFAEASLHHSDLALIAQCNRTCRIRTGKGGFDNCQFPVEFNALAIEFKYATDEAFCQ